MTVFSQFILSHKHLDRAGRSLRHFLDKVKEWHFNSTSNEVIWPKKFLCPAPSKCLSERINWIISRIPHRISKIIFVYGSYEFLAILEGKIREAPFFDFFQKMSQALSRSVQVLIKEDKMDYLKNPSQDLNFFLFMVPMNF